MEKYNYRESIAEDIRTYLDGVNLADYGNGYNEIYESLYDEMFVSDSITGNASGSYTFHTWKAEENLCHNLDLLHDALYEFGYSDLPKQIESAEWCDVTIRCYLLGEVLGEVLGEIME